MEQLWAALQQADDDYLIGLSNKGIWKRAYKDLEGETPSLSRQGEDAQVTLKSEICVIKNPLGESSCSCPSSGICRHVMTAILWLKGKMEQNGQEILGVGETQDDREPPDSQGSWKGQGASDGGKTQGSQGTQGNQGSSVAQGNQTGNMTEKMPEDFAGETSAKDISAGKASARDGSAGKASARDISAGKSAARETSAGKASAPREEFLSVPLDRLKRACGNRRFQGFLKRVRTREQPKLSETSIVTVEIPWEKATVRLLSPLEYSTCTCHSKELCGHKAQALLLYQLKYEKIHLKDLEALEVQESSIDMELAKDAAGKVRENILVQFEMGLSRQSLEVEESLERLAVICHRAQLADFENKLREAASDYRQYFKRSAAFRTEELFRKLLRLHGLVGQVLAAKTPAQLLPLAGSFRSDYELVGRLRLTGMGARSFSSKTGYEGEIYYFLETGKKKWYTWTDARPLFYEGVRRRPSSAAGQAGAPWGLPCSREQMSEMEFELTDAKAAAGERLSVSQDTKGEIVGPRNLDTPEIQELIYEDYDQLLNDYFGSLQNGSHKGSGAEDFNEYNSPDSSGDGGEGNGSEDSSGGKGGWRRERLALVRAFRWEEPSFDSISQQFSWGLRDRKGRTLFISLRYTKEERLTIALLERLEQRLKLQEEKNLLFLGAVYLDNGRLCLYPIEFYRERRKMTEESPTAESWNTTGESLTAASRKSEEGRMIAAIPSTVLDAFEQYRKEASRTLSDLLVSGLSSVQEEILTALSILAEDGRMLGLSFAGEEFSAIKEMLEGRRHQMDFQPVSVIDAMERLSRYLTVCGLKLSFDRARSAMEPEKDI